jgi:glycosyltransferase involved in cell wall biosynthesis
MASLEKIFFLGRSDETYRRHFSGFDLASTVAEATVVAASDWRELAAMSREAFRGKRLVCLLSEKPYADFHDPGFRDLPGMVALWLAPSGDSLARARILQLPSTASGDSAEAVESKLLACSPFQPLAREEAHPRKRNPESALSRGLRRIGLVSAPWPELTVCIFREFVKPPYGGANQFMLALKDAFERRGVRVLVNEVSDYIDGYYFDSLWFDEKLLAKLERVHRPTVVHRIDGPIHLYRGKDKEIDDKIFATNKRLATSTVIQSDFTLEKVFETGYRPVRPTVIRNAVNPAIFFPQAKKTPLKGRKARIIASSWSDNPNKGGPVYKWLEENLDWSRYEFTFVGRCSEELRKAKVIAPVSSEKLAELLNEHDIYITASQNDPCSNALIEALSCGLPAIALKSGGHPELVAEGGLCFSQKEEIPALLDQISERYDWFGKMVHPPQMEDVAERYLRLVKEP